MYSDMSLGLLYYIYPLAISIANLIAVFQLPVRSQLLALWHGFYRADSWSSPIRVTLRTYSLGTLFTY